MIFGFRSLGCFFALLLLSTAALGQEPSDADKATARQLAVDGFSALDRKDYAKASELLDRAQALYQAPTIFLGLARARVGLGKLVAAQEAYNRAVNDALPPKPSAQLLRAVEDARAELGQLMPRISSLTVEVQGAPAPVVSIDGVKIPGAAIGTKRPVDPGGHVVRASAAGFATQEKTVTLAEGKSENVQFELKADPNAPSMPPPSVELRAATSVPTSPASTGADMSSKSNQKYFAYGALGLGAAGLALGGITGAMAMLKHNDLSTQCPTSHCSSSLQSTLQGTLDSYHTMAGISTVGFIAGGALATTGAILWLTSPKAQPKQATLAPVIGFGFVGAEGRF